jgi:hypothetical protein
MPILYQPLIVGTEEQMMQALCVGHHGITLRRREQSVQRRKTVQILPAISPGGRDHRLESE